jgi:hypothetical protein
MSARNPPQVFAIGSNYPGHHQNPFSSGFVAAAWWINARSAPRASVKICESRRLRCLASENKVSLTDGYLELKILSDQAKAGHSQSLKDALTQDVGHNEDSNVVGGTFREVRAQGQQPFQELLGFFNPPELPQGCCLE